MPPSTAARSQDQILEFHEERIQRLESDAIPKLTAQVATVAVQQTQLGEKMDGLLATMQVHAQSSGEKLDKIGVRVGVLEETNKKLDWAKNILKKAWIPIGLAGAGLIGAGADELVKWLAK
jgi:hypothetical protein